MEKNKKGVITYLPKSSDVKKCSQIDELFEKSTKKLTKIKTNNDEINFYEQVSDLLIEELKTGTWSKEDYTTFYRMIFKMTNEQLIRVQSVILKMFQLTDDEIEEEIELFELSGINYRKDTISTDVPIKFQMLKTALDLANTMLSYNSFVAREIELDSQGTDLFALSEELREIHENGSAIDNDMLLRDFDAQFSRLSDFQIFSDVYTISRYEHLPRVASILYSSASAKALREDTMHRNLLHNTPVRRRKEA